MPTLLATAAQADSAPVVALETLRVPLAPIEIRLIEQDEQLPIDYENAILLAAAKNLDILEARVRLEEARAAQLQAAGSLLPSLSGSLTARRIDGEIQASFGELDRRAFSTINPAVGVSISVNPGESILDLLAAHKRVGASEFAEEDVTQGTLALVAAQYFELLRTQAQVNIATSALATATELARLAYDREQLGVGLRADVARARARRAHEEVTLAKAEENFRAASVNLADTLRLEPQVVLFPNEDAVERIMLVVADQPLGPLLAAAVARRPALRELAMQIGAAQDERAASWWKALGPEVYGVFEESAIGRSFDVNNRQIYGGFIGWTLSPSSFGEVQVSMARLEQTRLQRKRVEQRIRSEVVKARDRVVTADERLDAAHRGVEAAEQSLVLSQDRFRGGVGLDLEVLEAQEALTTARTALIGAIVDYNIAQVRLLLALGDVSEETLLRPSAVTSP